jgi:PAS domain S-box-containing protein
MERELERLKQREKKLILLHQAEVELAAMGKWEDVLLKVVKTAAELTDAEGAALYLLENNKLILRALKRAGKIEADAIDDLTHSKNISFFDHFKPKLLNPKDIERTTGDFPASLIGVSLCSKEEKIGVLCSYNCKPEKKFSNDDEEVLEFFSRFASAEISKKEVINADKGLNTLESLRTISQSMLSDEELPVLLEVIANNALKVLEADIVVLYEYNNSKKDVELPPIVQGYDIRDLDRLKKRGETHKESALFKLVDRCEPFYAPNAKVDWDTLFHHGKIVENREDNFVNREKIHSSAGIPLRTEEELMGILFINYRNPCAFPPTLKKKIELFSNEAALAIRNKKIISQKERYIKELSVLNQIVRKISTSVTLEINEILNLIYKQTGKLMDVNNFFVALYDKESNTVSFEFAVEDGQYQELGVGKYAIRKAGNGLTEYVIRTKKSLLIEENADKWFKEHIVNLIGTGTKCWLGVPMILENEALGVIAVQDDFKEHAYDHGNKKILETIASHAAASVRNASLLQTIGNQVAQLEGINKISQEIITSSMNIESVMHTVLEKAVKLSNSDAGEILFHNERKKLIKAVFTYNFDELKNIEFNADEGMAGRVLNEGIPLFTNDYFSSKYKLNKLDQTKFREKIKGVLQVPLKWQDKMLGILALSYEPGSNCYYTQKDIEFLNLFAGPASIAISIARYISFQKTLLINNPDAIVAVDNEGFFTLFNKSSEQLMGIKSKDIIGKESAQYYFDGKDEAKRINRLLIECEKRLEPVKNIGTAVKGVHGERIPILFSGAILRNELNEKIGSIGIMTDLREIDMKNAQYHVQQHFLNEIEQYPQNITIKTPADLQDILIEILKKARIFCQTEYLALFACTAEDALVLKAAAWDGIPGPILQKLPHFNWKKAGLLKKDTDKELSLKNELDFINRWWPTDRWKDIILSGIRGHNAAFFNTISCGVPVRLADNYRAVLVFGPFSTTISDMERADFIREVAKRINTDALSWLQALYLREKNKESHRSIDLIIHRSRVFLQQVIGKFSLIQRHLKDESYVKECASEGEMLITNLSRVVSRVMTSPVAEVERDDFDFQQYPLPVLIQNCVEDFKEKAEKEERNINIDSNIENLPYAEIDKLLLSVALGNLIDNALKYSYKNTIIQVYSEYNTQKEEVKIIIQDFGEQMSEDARRNLLEPGTRWGMSSRARRLPGTGFGLWEASIIASAHRGHVNFSSVYEWREKAHRVKVWITLPIEQNK